MRMSLGYCCEVFNSLQQTLNYKASIFLRYLQTDYLTRGVKLFYICFETDNTKSNQTDVVASLCVIHAYLFNAMSPNITITKFRDQL